MLFVIIAALAKLAFPDSGLLRDGDVIFQESQSTQSRAIQLATKSRYSHMGLVFSRGGRWYVYEAVGPVKFTAFQTCISRGRGGHFVVKRLRNQALLTPAAITKMRQVTMRYAGKPYDWTFEWDDRRMYCSELVWKVYKASVDVELGHLQTLGSFDLSNPVVRKKLAERFDGRIPLDEPVISPGAIFDSPQLVEVIRQ